MKAYSIALLGALLLSVTLSACNRTPEIPDEVPSEGRTYRATGDEGAKPATAVDGTASEGDATGARGGKAGGEMRATGPVALVNDEPISAADFQKEMDKIAASGQLPPHIIAQLEGDRREQLKAQIVEGMVIRRLIEQAIAKQPMTITEEEVTARMEQMEEEIRAASQGRVQSLEEMMTQMGVTREELRTSVEQSIALERLVQQAYDYKGASEEEARIYYNENIEDFHQPEQVRARHILIKINKPDDELAWKEGKKRIDALHKKAAAKDADFDAIAKEHSEDGSAPMGGDLGYFQRDMMVPEFERVAFGLTNGAVSEPLRSRFGWHIIKREDYQAEGPIAFDLVKEQLILQLTNLRFQESLEQYVDGLREKAKIVVKLENIT